MRRLIKIIAALAAIMLLALAISGVVRLVTATANIFVTDGGDGEIDPMFAEEAEMTTRPPELASEEGAVFQDNSANWTMSEETPVDMTAEELAREAGVQDAAG